MTALPSFQQGISPGPQQGPPVIPASIPQCPAPALKRGARRCTGSISPPTSSLINARADEWMGVTPVMTFYHRSGHSGSHTKTAIITFPLWYLSFHCSEMKQKLCWNTLRGSAGASRPRSTWNWKDTQTSDLEPGLRLSGRGQRSGRAVNCSEPQCPGLWNGC